MAEHYTQYAYQDGSGYLIHLDHVSGGYPTSFAAVHGTDHEARRQRCFEAVTTWGSQEAAEHYRKVFCDKKGPIDLNNILDGRGWTLVELHTVVIPLPE